MKEVKGENEFLSCNVELSEGVEDIADALKLWEDQLYAVEPLLAISLRLQHLQDTTRGIVASLATSKKKLLQSTRCHKYKRQYLLKMEDTPKKKTALSDFSSPDPIDEYVRLHKCKRTRDVNVNANANANTDAGDVSLSVTAEEHQTCVEALLRWVDESMPSAAEPHLTASRKKLVALLTKGASHGKAKPTKETLSNADAFCSKHWAYYAEQLHAAHNDEYAALRRVCATDIGERIRSQMKWEQSQSNSVHVVTPAASAGGLQRSFTQLLGAKDALADCQKAVTVLLSLLGGALDEYDEQTHNVIKREEAFWNNVRIAECESEALRSLSLRVKKHC
ncbi:hypothetical protein, conserved [Trypanosoma brucei gambiense DAL972]|uniref:Uncharacterized protein n=1 Tax=Trypanosoma brucei gambiense (strain MHOM/CI/86/DAL972) TaxID=679716 RepID=C9ZKE3_TRYB9|nr:hypothetical protein, conserved [Trypanosoma brucei gambiense DAL972]CBH09907.1 hypothetical protein, conserved [Trypanosoma brucei gambiense DAL972]|eukprot:XP_011772200.1 hypothetical protein, conserved [Trypanosoma brucei gambiense DAL972]